VRVDGEFVDYADELYLPSPEVIDLYPWIPVYFTANAGYTYSYDSVAADLADGEHVLVIWTEDQWGGRTMIGERRFVIDNPQADGGSPAVSVD